MSQQTKSNLIFGIIIFLMISATVVITYIAIKNHNEPGNPEIKEPEYYTFDSVEYSDTVDVFKKYKVNPITVDLKSEKVTISGLKNKEVENKINEKLSKLKTDPQNSCFVSFNVSNVLSVSCFNNNMSVNLENGEDIKIEEIFNPADDLRRILQNAIYESVCMYSDCYMESYLEDGEVNNVENDVAILYRKLQNRNYTMSISNHGFSLQFNVFTGDDEYRNTVYIPYYQYKDHITIFNRFADAKEGLYEKEQDELCYPVGCRNYNEEDYLDGYDLLNDKSFLNYSLMNYSDSRLNAIRTNDKKKTYDMEKLNEDLLKIIHEKEKLNKINPYSYVYISSSIYGTNKDYDIVVYGGNIRHLNSETITDFALGYSLPMNFDDVESLYGILVFNNGKLVNLKTRDDDLFEDIERDLIAYFRENGNEYGSHILNNDDEKWYAEIARNAKIQVDIQNGLVYMLSEAKDESYLEYGGYPYVSYKDVIPLDRFILKDSYNN